MNDLEGAPLPSPDAVPPAITLREVEQVIAQSEATARYLDPAPEIPGAYLLKLDGGTYLVTMRGGLY